jgi:hypothetical protein
MATLEVENAARSELSIILEELASFKVDELGRAKELGPDINFDSGIAYFSRTLKMFDSIRETDLQDLSHQKIIELTNTARPALEHFRQVKRFSLLSNPSNPIAVRDQLINQIRDYYDNVFLHVAPLVAFAVRSRTDFERVEREAVEKLKHIDEISADHEKVMAASRNEASQILDEVRRMAAESGVSQHSIHFKQEADQHEKNAKRWLAATICLVLLTVGAGVLVSRAYFSLIPSMTSTQSLQLAISKVVIIFVLLTATFWTGRSYRAHRHNAVVNRHRQNALSTFQAFVKAAVDSQTKDAVLLQATQCIFSPQQTGYVTGEPEAGSIPQVLEIVRNLGSKT